MTALKAVIIIGDGLENSDKKIQNFVNSTPEKSQYLVIGDGNVKVTQDMIADSLRGKEVDSKTKILIHFHGELDADKSHRINGRPTSEMFKHVSDCINEGKANPIPLQIYLLSCYGSSAARNVELLPTGSILVTYGPDDDFVYGSAYFIRLLKDITLQPLTYLSRNLLQAVEQGISIGIKCENRTISETLNPMHEIVLDLKDFRGFLLQRIQAVTKLLLDLNKNKGLPNNIYIPGIEEIQLKWTEDELEYARGGYFYYQVLKASDSFIKFLETNKNKKELKEVMSYWDLPSILSLEDLDANIKILKVLSKNNMLPPDQIKGASDGIMGLKLGEFKADALAVDPQLFDKHKIGIISDIQTLPKRDMQVLLKKFLEAKKINTVIYVLENMRPGIIDLKGCDAKYIETLIEKALERKEDKVLAMLISSYRNPDDVWQELFSKEDKNLICSVCNALIESDFPHKKEALSNFIEQIDASVVDEVFKAHKDMVMDFPVWSRCSLLNGCPEIFEDKEKPKFFGQILRDAISAKEENFVHKAVRFGLVNQVTKPEYKDITLDILIQELNAARAEGLEIQNQIIKNVSGMRYAFKVEGAFDKSIHSKGDNQDCSLDKEIQILENYRDKFRKQSFVEKEKMKPYSSKGPGRAWRV